MTPHGSENEKELMSAATQAKKASSNEGKKRVLIVLKRQKK